MKSFRYIKREAGLLAVVFATILSAFVPAMASAATVTSRSVELSSAASGATGVSYEVHFTAPTAAEAFVVDFCTTGTVGTACTSPSGFDASGAATTGVTVGSNKSTVTVTDAITADEDVTFTLSDITNPDSTGVFYARIVTYDTTANVTNYTATALGTGAEDSGSVAMSINNTVNVSGTVLETMTFCVSGTDIAKGCGGTLGSTALKLGTSQGGTTALSADTLSTGDMYAQVSTNATHGVVVNLKSDATSCGGLLRAGATAGTCDIAAAGTSGTVAAGDAKFGVKLYDATDATDAVEDDPSVLGTLVPGTNYNTSDYHMNGVTDNTAGVTSTYGDPFFNSNGAPVSNKNMEMTFAASITSGTPAGDYSANLSLIATGTF